MDVNDQQCHLVLASRSPQRRRLLKDAGYRFEVRLPAESTESAAVAGEAPAQLAARHAYQKAADVARTVRQGLILGCDTIAECDGQILGKPDGIAHARRMLETLCGRQHRVLSGLCLWQMPERHCDVRVAVTSLRMDPLADEQIDEYLASGAWKGKAGAMGYQDQLGWVHLIEGSETNVVGLPMELLAEMLANPNMLANPDMQVKPSTPVRPYP